VDGDWIEEEPEILLQKGRMQNKSIIIGVTDDEATIVLCKSFCSTAREEPIKPLFMWNPSFYIFFRME
jgi:hypothetical protein